jgi:hypothetical protein
MNQQTFVIEQYNPQGSTLHYQLFQPAPGQTFAAEGEQYQIAVVTPDEVIARVVGQSELVYRYFAVDEVCGYLTPVEVQS